ncbi:unnamed protein product [Arctogadus glacialis]
MYAQRDARLTERERDEDDRRRVMREDREEQEKRESPHQGESEREGRSDEESVRGRCPTEQRELRGRDRQRDDDGYEALTRLTRRKLETDRYLGTPRDDRGRIEMLCTREAEMLRSPFPNTITTITTTTDTSCSTCLLPTPTLTWGSTTTTTTS